MSLLTERSWACNRLRQEDILVRETAGIDVNSGDKEPESGPLKIIRIRRNQRNDPN